MSIDPMTSQSESAAGEVVKRLDELKKLAEAATPGPWKALPNAIIWAEPCKEYGLAEVTQGDPKKRPWLHVEADATFIAAANPATVLYLLALIDAQSRAIEAARDALGSFVEQELSSEMDDDQLEHADFQGGWDELVRRARTAAAAIAALPKGDV